MRLREALTIAFVPSTSGFSWLPPIPSSRLPERNALQRRTASLDDSHSSRLRNLDDPDTAALLEACEAEVSVLQSRLSPLTDAIASELLHQGGESERYHWVKLGSFEWSRQLRGDWPVYLRRSASGKSDETVVLDTSKAPAVFPSEYVGGQPFVALSRGVSGLEVEPSRGLLVAYTVDPEGNEKYLLTVKAIDDGDAGTAASLASEFDVDAAVVWGGSTVSNSKHSERRATRKTPERKGGAPKKMCDQAPQQREYTTGSIGSIFFIYYARMDGTGRPCILCQRRVWASGVKVSFIGEERVLYEENDQRFRLKFGRNRAGKACVSLFLSLFAFSHPRSIPARHGSAYFSRVPKRRRVAPRCLEPAD